MERLHACLPVLYDLPMCMSEQSIMWTRAGLPPADAGVSPFNIRARLSEALMHVAWVLRLPHADQHSHTACYSYLIYKLTHLMST